ncbi:hypothetical protein A4D02_22830 [Niastella koreensis]|uniref:Bifunctional deaminase-reductase domain protein n=2 Tax=Niastella koreensis TaxID=354356 RepID=G8TEA4_NIAKG|nr:hypothetical protein [Niastella koreensis]AEV98314.1 hypothetical protein Niako_1958 [Niastella koreensis GR20-10]OQP53230.1 hypothetical protein A4D02_22830 [Niastella koreensis]
MSRKLILYIAQSLDGYIAKKDGNLDFLSMVEVPNEDCGYADHLQNIDTKDNNIEQQLTFRRSISYPTGLVQLWYDRKTDKNPND